VSRAGETDSCITLQIKGKSAWKVFEQEAGKHCIQRVPPTESRGRVHTSMVSVAVLELPKSQDFRLKDSEIEWEATKGSGPGGQHRNKTSSTVRMKHLPTGMTVVIDGRSQHQNRTKARRILEAKVAEHLGLRQAQTYNDGRQKQIGDRGRTQKIRTYNLKRGRAVDHRTNKKTGKVDAVLDGRFDLLR